MAHENYESETKLLEQLESFDMDDAFERIKWHLIEQGDEPRDVWARLSHQMEVLLVGAVQLSRRLFDDVNDRAESFWVNQVPEVSGWYWWRRDAASEAEILRVDYFGSGRFDSGIYFWRVGENLPSPVEDLEFGEWRGIVEPEMETADIPKHETTGKMARSSRTLVDDQASQKLG